MEYVNHIDSLLESLLSRESLKESDNQCQHCEGNVSAVWRCKDCSMGTPMCRRCIRISHQHNPFHRIERWNGIFFRPAELWEVGTYLLVRHHVGTPICETLKRQISFLESIEIRRDAAEQKSLHITGISWAPDAAPISHNEPMSDQYNAPSAPGDSENDLSEQKFEKYLQDLLEDNPDIEDPVEVLEVEDDEEENKEKDPPTINRYLGHGYYTGPDIGHENNNGPDGSSTIPIGTYIRVVHSNGIHNLAMVNCECQGHDCVAGDLLASRLLPASFDRMRTLFTVQLLDSFRLSNLELKASAYHFYNLLRRITAPMNPASVDDLYREFRRMTRLWRWMKRLKWAGYPCNNRPVKDVEAGELAVFCPACPQPGINIPSNWKDDTARHVCFL